MQQMHFTPFKYDAECMLVFFLILWTSFSEKKKWLELISPLRLFKHTILNKSS